MNIRGITTDGFGLNSVFIKWSHQFKVVGVDETKKGLITFHATLQPVLPDENMLAESVMLTTINNIDINNLINTLGIGDTYKPVVYVTRDSADITGKVPVYYYAVTEDTISVSSDGTVTPLKVGTAILGVFSQGVYKEITFNVKEPVYSVSIANKTENIGINYDYTLNIDCYKDNIKDTTPSITYTSSNPTIATIDNVGKITGIKQGTVKIQVTYNGVSDTMNVNIIPVNTITITNKINQLKVGQTYTPTINCTSNNITDTNPSLTYTSSDPSILSISNGTITVLKAGTATVVVTYKDKIDSVIIVCSNITYAVSITNKPSSAINNGSTYQLNTNCTQDGTVDTTPTITYTSSNTAIATVNSTGLISCIGIGSATITVTYHGVSDSVDINVVSAHEYVLSVSPTSMSINNGSTASITASVTDKGTTVSGASFTYSSDNTAVATVSASGVVTGISVGNANITASYIGQDNNTYSKTIPVTINAVLNKSIAITLDTSDGSDTPNKICNGETQSYFINESYSDGTKINDTFTIIGSAYERTLDPSYYTITSISDTKFSITNNKGDGTQYLKVIVTSKTDTTVSQSILIRLAGEW